MSGCSSLPLTLGKNIFRNNLMNRYTGGIKAVILDWSGTTADAHVIAPARVFVDVFEKHGVPITMEEARKPMGLRKDLHIAEILKQPNVRTRWTDAKQRPPTDHDVQNLFSDFVPMQVACLPEYTDLLPGTADTIVELREKYKVKIGSTTGFTKLMVDVLLEDAERQGYKPDSSVAGDQVQNNLGFRPAPFMVYQNLLNLGVWPIASVVKVDDTVSGVGEGLNAGCWTIGLVKYSNYTNIDTMVQWDSLTKKEKDERIAYSREKLLTSGAHYVADSIVDIPTILDDINLRLKGGSMP